MAQKGARAALRGMIRAGISRETFENKRAGLVVRGRFGASQYRNRLRFGIGFAQVGVAQLSASPSSVGEKNVRRRAVMKKLKGILLGMLVAMVVAAGAFAQKNSNDNRPPKENPRIIERPKPPPSNSNNNTNKKKPD